MATSKEFLDTELLRLVTAGSVDDAMTIAKRRSAAALVRSEAALQERDAMFRAVFDAIAVHLAAGKRRAAA